MAGARPRETVGSLQTRPKSGLIASLVQRTRFLPRAGGLRDSSLLESCDAMGRAIEPHRTVVWASARTRAGPPVVIRAGNAPCRPGTEGPLGTAGRRARHLKVSLALPIDSMKVFRVTGTFQM